MEDKLAPRAEERAWRQRQTHEDVYVKVRVKNGNMVISGLYIDGVRIEDILRNE
jgi:hypothetical protein